MTSNTRKPRRLSLKQALAAAYADQPTSPPAPAPVQPGSFPLCGCGCGVPTVTAKARFLSGHDARFAGLVGRGEIQPTPEQQALITEPLQRKIDGIRQTAVKREAAKQARAAAKQAAKEAYDAALATV